MKIALAFAAATLAPNSSPINDGYPPIRFMGEATAVVVFVDDVSSLCGKAPPGYVVLACAVPENHAIALPNPCFERFKDEQFAKIACHEKGHINGWPETHGD